MRRDLWTNRLLVGPMLVVLGSLIDPLRKQGNLFFGQGFAFPFGRHQFLISFGQSNPKQHLAVFGFTWNNGRIPVQITGRSFESVKSQSGLSVLLVRAMTGHALVGNQGLDLAIEINFCETRTRQTERKQKEMNEFSHRNNTFFLKIRTIMSTDGRETW